METVSCREAVPDCRDRQHVPITVRLLRPDIPVLMLRGDHGAVRRRDAFEHATGVPVVEEAQGIPAVERERQVMCKAVPGLFEIERRLKLTFGGKQRDHLAKDRGRPVGIRGHHGCLANQVADDRVEAGFVNMLALHEAAQGLRGIQRDVTSVPNRPVEVNAVDGEVGSDTLLMGGRRHNDGSLASGQRYAERLAHRIEQGIVVVVQLDGMRW